LRLDAMVMDLGSTNPAAPATRALVQRAQQEIAATGHVGDDTCRRLIQRLDALSADERWALLATLARAFATRPRAG
jgi:hypothetical protein